jgi:hypothetical protein
MGTPRTAKPAMDVTTDFGGVFTGAATPEPQPDHSQSSSACEPYREVI